MKKYALLLTALLALSGAAHAIGNITSMTFTPFEPKPGETVKFYIKTSGNDKCGARWIYSGPHAEPSDNDFANKQPNGGGQMDKAFANVGTYQVKVVGSPSLHPACTGSAEVTIQVKRPKLHIAGSSAPMVCPGGYDYYPGGDVGTPTDKEKGVAFCVKKKPACPDHFFPNFSEATGDLICTPNIQAACPDGWTGGVVDGKLVCKSKPQPFVLCPTTEKWQWGTKYYKENWNKMGCYENGKVAN